MTEKYLNHNIDSFLKTSLSFFLIIIVGLILPLFLLFIIHYTGYSEILEEIAKALVVLFLILRLPNLKLKIIAAVIFGFLFGMSENILYINDILQTGNFNIFWKRFLFPTPLHIITVLIILFSALKNKKFIILGTIMAIAVHLLFNQIIPYFNFN